MDSIDASSGSSRSSIGGHNDDTDEETQQQQQSLLYDIRGYQPPPTPPPLLSPGLKGKIDYGATEHSTNRSSAVLVRADGSGVCADGSEHTWKQVYPTSLWLIACLCCICCGPVYCYRHSQRRCKKCGIVIRHPIDA